MRSQSPATATLDADPTPDDDDRAHDPANPEPRRLAVRRAGKGVDPEAGFRSHRAIERVVAGTPWDERDLARAGRTVVIGGVGLVVAWFASSDTNDWSRQMLWIAVGVGLVTYTAIGIGRWVLSGLGPVRMVRRQVVADLQQIAAARPVPASADGDHWVVAANMGRAHRPSCPFVAGKAVESVGPRQIRARGLLPCEVCG